MSIELIRVQADDGQPVNIEAVKPKQVGQNYLCVFGLNGSREQVRPENLQKFHGCNWVASASGVRRILQVHVVYAALPVETTSWSDLVEGVEQVYYSPRSL